MNEIIELIQSSELTDIERITLAQHLITGIKITEKNKTLLQSIQDLALIGRVILESKKK